VFYLKINTFIEKVCEQIKYKPVRKSISEQIEQHLLEIKEEKIQENLSEDEAEEKATEAMGEPEKIGKRLNKIHRPKLDWQLFSLIMILIFFGIFNIFFKTQAKGAKLGESIINMLIGLTIGIFTYFGNYKKLQKHSNMIYFIATVMSILSFTSIFGYSVGGVRYLSTPYILIVIPTVFITTLYVIAFVGFLVDSKEKKMRNLKLFGKEMMIQTNGIVKIVSSSLTALILINSLPSIPNTILLGITYLVIGVVYDWKMNKNEKKVISILCGGLAIIAIVLITQHSDNMFIQRIRYSLHPQEDAQGLGYVGMLQKEIIENSKAIGKADTELISETKYIIAQESNYTFIYLMRKLGVVAVGILAITITLIAIKVILNVKLIKNMYGKMLILGLGMLYILQSVINVLMNLNLGIQTNINLPFVCEGEAYFAINCISMALILSVYRRKDIDLEMT